MIVTCELDCILREPTDRRCTVTLTLGDIAGDIDRVTLASEHFEIDIDRHELRLALSAIELGGTRR